MVVTLSVDWADPRAAQLRAAMETEMRSRYADRAVLFPDMARAVSVSEDAVVFTGIAVSGEDAVGHIALRWTNGDLEIKRMYVAPARRGTGVSTALLRAAEEEARRLGAERLILQTGDRQPDAVRLYEKAGYRRIPIFPPYDGLPFSNCFEKPITASEPEAAAR